MASPQLGLKFVANRSELVSTHSLSINKRNLGSITHLKSYYDFVIYSIACSNCKAI